MLLFDDVVLERSPTLIVFTTFSKLLIPEWITGIVLGQGIQFCWNWSGFEIMNCLAWLGRGYKGFLVQILDKMTLNSTNSLNRTVDLSLAWNRVFQIDDISIQTLKILSILIWLSRTDYNSIVNPVLSHTIDYC